MRTCGLVFDGTKTTLDVFAQAFMCNRMRLRRSAASPSRKPTVSFTPPPCQYLVVSTAMCAGVGANPGTRPTSRSTGGWLAGLISVAVGAASIQWFRGRNLGRQTSVGVGMRAPSKESVYDEGPGAVKDKSHNPSEIGSRNVLT